MSVLRYIEANFLGLDLMVSALSGGAPYQTLSARFGKARKNGSIVGTTLAVITDFFALHAFNNPNHCEGARVAYDKRMTASPSFTG